MRIHGQVDDPDRGLDDPPVLVATIAGQDVVTLASLTAMRDDYLLWRASEGEED